jgi:hypothetical protein
LPFIKHGPHEEIFNSSYFYKWKRRNIRYLYKIWKKNVKSRRGIRFFEGKWKFAKVLGINYKTIKPEDWSNWTPAVIKDLSSHWIFFKTSFNYKTIKPEDWSNWTPAVIKDLSSHWIFFKTSLYLCMTRTRH